MIISFKQVQQVMQSYGKQGNQLNKGKVEKTAKSSKLDEINLSTQAQVVQTARQVIDGLPDVRAEKVAQIKEAVKCGSYNISGEDVAEKMVGRTLVDKLV